MFETVLKTCLKPSHPRFQVDRKLGPDVEGSSRNGPTARMQLPNLGSPIDTVPVIVKPRRSGSVAISLSAAVADGCDESRYISRGPE